MKTYALIAAMVYLSAMAFCIAQGAGYALGHMRHCERVWFQRARRATLLGGGALAICCACLLVTGDTAAERRAGLGQSIFLSFQFFAAWFCLPAALALLARQAPPRPPMLRPGWLTQQAVIRLLLIGVAVTIGSAFLLYQSNLEISESARALMLAGGRLRSFGIIVSLYLAVLVEEILFRGVIQSWLDHVFSRWTKLPYLSIGITSVLWAAGHANIATTFGAKELHILLVGVVLGWVRRREGLIGSVVVHAVLNSGAALPLFLVLLGYEGALE